MRKNDNQSPSFEDVLSKFLSRRSFFKGAGTMSLGAYMSACSQNRQVTTSSLSFEELPHGLNEHFEVAKGYETQVLLRWGDPLFDGVSEFSPYQQSADEQSKRFGYNNDFVGFVPINKGTDESDHGLLVVNHEYTNPELMFPGSPPGETLNKEHVDIEIAAHGLSVVEIRRQGSLWHVIKNSPYNRRITPNTPMKMTGPAAGSSRLTSIISQDGVHTLGTYGNCAGGVTPWGTILTGEENVDAFFLGKIEGLAEEENYTRFGVGHRYKNWGSYHDRWQLEKNPSELLHVGWIVEIDPFDPESLPKKRTNLGRCKHEGANVFINDDGHVVAYTGDDQRFEYIYKFVSKGRYDPDNRAANLDLLEHGTLYVARFNEDGTLNWLPLVFDEGPLTKENGFNSQADVLLDTRKAADLVGATPMDRPEDVEVNPVNGRVYAMLTNNTQRTADQLDAANPRPHNGNGQVIEFWPESGDHKSETFRWELFLLAGNPHNTTTLYHPDISKNGWLSCPDNCAFDSLGNLWIATDGAEKQGVGDGLWATEVNGQNRAMTKRFMRIPIGAEMCGPFFTPNSENLFCSVQHPGNGSSFEQPSTRWPDFRDDMPPRPAVVVTRKQGGGRVGS